ncbi:hypothetical protein TRAPUB_12248 [Trametes pubescens]|uniref:Uncharacterized protein n=1 Tax=Trametes pubescens TaxID=154538 RepID=A0A1M2VUB6_TRAPU|nr:hypothetical protein TRAPUB_12248 [Trametes pubescens]
MKLTHLPRIDTALLSLIASRFVSLEILELSCTERLDEQCCWLCFEESSTCTIHSPIPDLFVTEEHLTVCRPIAILPSSPRRLTVGVLHLQTSFCKALAPLMRLETLFLGIFLSDVDVFTRHLERCATIVVASPRTPNCYPTPPFGPNACVTCCGQHATEVQERECLAKTLFLRALPSLVNIGFSSWFPLAVCGPKEENAPGLGGDGCL